MATAIEPVDGDIVERKTVKALTLLSLKRSYDLFVGNYGHKTQLDKESQKAKIASKVQDEYASVLSYKEPAQASTPAAAKGLKPAAAGAAPASKSDEALEPTAAEAAGPKSTTAKLIDSMAAADKAAEQAKQQQLVLFQAQQAKALVPTAGGGHREYQPSAAVAKRLASKWPRPKWHPPWKLYRVCSGHQGWVRSIAFDPSNEWFCTGGADRTIKIWDTASGQLKLTLTGHIEQVTGLAVSPRHPYMFSCGLDKMVKCWDMEYNKVIRHYHGHLSGVYALQLHPTLDILFSGGRDSVCRVWDMRTKVQIHCLSGHDETVCSILSNATDPQVITGSHDKTVRMWDLRRARTLSTLTYHKKSVRAMAMHPTEYAFASASADNIKKFQLPEGKFLHNMLQNQRTIVNSMAINEEGVMVTGGDNGSLWFWDWQSGNNFQAHQTQVQPGSLESEAGIFAMSFDLSGSRLLTCEADKTVKFYKEDTSATPETHPVTFRPPRDIKRF